MKINKNSVSYFLAGYKAGLVSGGDGPKDIEFLDYTTTTFSNEAKELFRAYESKEFDKEGLQAMYEFYKQKHG